MFTPLWIVLLTSTAPAVAQNEPLSGEFIECEDAELHASLKGTQRARVEAPLDHAEAVAGTVELFVRKFPAKGYSEGQLWLIADGPGEPKTSFYPFIQTVLAAAPGLDLLISDHRGTGFSTRLCAEEEGPSSKAGSEVAGEEWSRCFGALNAQADRTTAFTITNAAHDLDLLTFDTSERTYLYGVSYGTQLTLRSKADWPKLHC